jgi:hypothetical protein
MPSRRMSDDDSIYQGDVVHTLRIDRYASCRDGASLVQTFRAPKGHRFVFLYLGYEPRDGSAPFDSIAALKAMGWTPPPALEAERHQDLVSDAGLRKCL